LSPYLKKNLNVVYFRPIRYLFTAVSLETSSV
jgi:hypothetical protein